MGTRGKASIRWGILAGMAVAFLGVGRESLAAHFSFVLTSDCYQCHNLNPDAVATDPATSYIMNDTFVKRMRTVNGGTTPATFGCNFCHQYATNTVMRDAYLPLKSGSSLHPVDFPYSVDARRNVTINFTSADRDKAIYNSNWDNSWTNFANQINCIDCHDVAMDNAAYPNHSALWSDNTATAPQPGAARYYNPFMLRNVPGTAASGYSWSGGTVQGHAPNRFCLLTCHDNSPGNTSRGTTMGHYGWGAYGADNTLKEPSGTAIKGGASVRCADCHETHTSRTKDNLFGELGNQASSQSNNLISEADCTGVCHSDTSFLASGHKTRPATAGFTCLSCHNSGVSHRNATNPRRLSGSEDSRKASLTQNMAANGRDDNYDGVVDDAGEATFAYSFESSCRTCHSAYVGHGGTIAGASPSTGTASCLSCHDPHGKGVFNGTDNNIKMIRAQILGDNTVYRVRADMWRSDGRGACENPACHSGKPMGDNTLATGTIMGDVADHRAANVTYSTDCTGCHLHTTESGSFQPACNGCHDYPGQTHLSSAHVLSPVHKIHAYKTDQTLPTAETGYGFPCGTCHYSFNHNQMGVANGTQWDNSNNAVVQVMFDPAVNPPGPPDPSYALGATPYTGTCSNLTCHGARLPTTSQGTQVTPRWNVASDGDCGTCHRATGANPPGTAAHVKHANSDSNAGYGYGCQTCHYSTTPDGATIPVSGRATHVNRLAEVAFNPGNAWVSGGTYSGTTTVGDNTVSTCANIYCHSPGYSRTAPFDNGALGMPNWNAGAALACNACHGASGQTGIRVGMPAYANGTPKANTHGKHLADGFGCQVCHYATTQNGTSVVGASRAFHVNGADNVTSEGNLAVNPGATPKQRSHNFTFDNAANTCNTAACHGYGPAAPVWGQTAGIPISCSECHRYAAGAAATADFDDFAWDNGTMSKIRDSEWTTSGHGRTSGTYNSGRSYPGSGSTSAFPSCTTHCHTSGVSHNTTTNPFRLTDKMTPTPTTDFSDSVDPQSDNRVCLDCHSASGALPAGSTLHVEQNHYGTKHTAQTLGGSFCWDCHDPHGDANDSMVQDNVTRVSDGVYGVPSTAAGSIALTTFSRTNLNGEAYNAVYDWGDYVDNTAPYRGVCQVCHNDPGTASGETSGGAAYFSPTRFAPTHNKQAGIQGDRCTVCHMHNADFAPVCNTCHGDATPGGGGGMPPHAPLAGNQVWSSSVDNLSALAGVGNHRTAAGIVASSHGDFTCEQCHTNTPGSGGTHNVSGQQNATMTNIATHNWYNGALASWENGGTGGVTGGVVDDSCTNIDCHAPYYNANAAASGTPAPYRRYWINATLWDCYTCHAYDGRTGVGLRQRPGGADNTMATGAHGRHVGATQMTCSRCHDVTGYSATTWPNTNAAHKNGFLNWSFAGAPNPPGYPAVPGNAYSVATGSAAPTDDNTTAGHRAWGTCSNIYCHSIVQTATGGPLTGSGGEYKTASWDNATTGQCGACHNDDLNTSGGTGVPMASGSHAQHLAAAYGMTCDACHTGNGTGHATHADGIIEVPMGDNAWRVFTLTAATTIFDRAAAPGVDNANKTPGAAVGRCSSIPCHTDGRAVPGAPRVSPAVWGDTQAAAANCTYCHGGNAATGAAMATDSHPKHVTGAKLACGKCHAATVSPAADNVITAYDNHLNGVRNVAFPADVGGTYDNNLKTCTATYCHGTGASPAWGSGPIAGCSVCHQSQGAGTGVASFTGPHRAHVDNTADHRYRFACEQCHAWNATVHPIGSHAGGDDNLASARTVDAKFTDNAMASWAYDNATWLYKTFNLWASPYGAAAPSPGYADLVAAAGTDTTNTRITWSAGTCSNVYCHSNANPAVWTLVAPGSGGNAYRTPSWDNATSVTCTSCHLGPDTTTNMGVAGGMSYGHRAHLATDTYRYSCDECHADVVPNDCTTRILDPGGFAFHLNGNKQNITGSTTLKLSTINNSGMVYNPATKTCTNNYCHSDGTRKTPPFAPRTPSFNFSWDNTIGPTCGSGTCHVSPNSFASSSPYSLGHGRHPYTCSGCHTDTVSGGGSSGLHADGRGSVTIPTTYDNDAITNNNYDYATQTCSAIWCHGGRPVAWTDNNLSCDACHTTINNLNAADVDDFRIGSGSPMSKINPDDYANRGHGRNGALPWGAGKNPALLFGRAMECRDCHDSSQLHNSTTLSSNPFRLLTTINMKPVTLDNVDTVCYACHSAAAVKDHATAVTGGGTRGLGHSQKCVDCHDVHGEGNIYMVHDSIVWQDNTATPDNATSNGFGVPYFPASRATVVFTSAATGAGFANSINNPAGPYTGICEVCHENTLQYRRSGSLTGPQGHSQSACIGCHQHSLGFKASCNSCHGETTGPGSGGMPPYAPSAGNNPWASRGTVDNLSWLPGVGNHRSGTGITGSSHESYGCSECHTNTPGSGGTHDNASNVNAAMTNLVARRWTDNATLTTWTPRTDGRTGSVIDDSCNNVNCHSPYYNSNSARSATPFPYERFWTNRTIWDCYTCHAYDGFTATSRPVGAENAIASGSHYVHVVAVSPSPLRLVWSCGACHDVSGYSAQTWPNTNANHKDGSVELSITGAVGPMTLAGSYSTNPALPQPPTDNAAGHRAWGTCNNVYCHSTVQKNNPDGPPNDGVTYIPTPQWGSASSTVVCGSCHKAGMDVHSTAGWDNITTGSHAAHVAVVVNNFTGISRCNTCHQYSGRTGCTGCHAAHAGDNSLSLHLDGVINMGFTGTLGTASLSGAWFDNNADGSPDNTIVPGMPYGTCRSLYCHGTGTPALAGGANQATGTTNIPKWGDAATSRCGSCHAAPGATANYPPATYVGTRDWPSSGAHTIHMDNTSMPGPRIGACTDCHTASTAATHVNGRVDLRTSYLDNTAAALDNTSTCNPCHGLGAAAAKANWATAGALNCLTCHMDGSLANSRADMTGVTAPNVGGDNATYGSYYTGHNRASGLYGSGNVAANRACADCHDLAQRHINHVDDNTYQGNRLTATVPWNSQGTGNTLSGLCNACHRTTASPSAAKNRINTHGNTNFADRLEAVFAERTCDQCHEPHGMVSVTAAPAGVNLWMINPTITVVPGPPAVTASPVRLFSKTGANSFDNTGTASDLCRACHANGSNPGFPMTYNVAGQHAAPGYTGDERGKDCSTCHSHNQDDNTATVDGLMPLACNDCHSYPGLDNAGASLKQMSAVHGKHVGTPTNVTTNTKGYACTLCHYNYDHNQSRITRGTAWPANYYDNVNINFDPAWNPGSTTYRGLAVPTTGNGGTGACAGLYCHGDSATLSAGWGGSDNTPVWNQPSTAACGTCHDTGTADTTAGTVFSTKNHPVHLDNVAQPRGPENPQFGAAANCAQGTGCHTKYGLTPSSTHANNEKTLRSTATDNGEVGATLATTQVCRNCHPTYTSARILTSGDDLVRTQANWDNPSYLVSCLTCHNGQAVGTQARANLDGSGGTANAIEGTLYTMQHGVVGLGCGWCHTASAGHIGVLRNDATNPYRFGSYMDNYATLGKVDYICEWCHTTGYGGIPEHAWRASGSGSYGPTAKDNTDTHPTTVTAVGTGKDRWYQVPSGTYIPLFGDILDASYNRSSGSNNYVLCVTCHDPHGVGTSPVPSAVRRFSGQNTDAKGSKGLRFNYSTGTPTALCSQCHK